MLSSSRAAVPARGQATGLPCPGASSPLLASPLLSSPLLSSPLLSLPLLHGTSFASRAMPTASACKFTRRDETRRGETRRNEARPDQACRIPCFANSRPDPRRRRNVAFASSRPSSANRTSSGLHVRGSSRIALFNSHPPRFSAVPSCRFRPAAGDILAKMGET